MTNLPELSELGRRFRRVVTGNTGGEQMAQSDVTNWLRVSLHTGRSGLPQAADDDPVDPIIRIEPQLDDRAGLMVRAGAFELLVEWIRHPSWPESVTHSLLWLIRQLRLRDANLVLQNLAQDGDRFDALAPVVQDDILSLLIDLPLPLDPRFWLNLADRDRERFGPWAFSGLVRADWDEAVRFVTTLPLNNRVQTSLRLRIPAIVTLICGPSMNQRLKTLANALRHNPLLEDLFRAAFAAAKLDLPSFRVEAGHESDENDGCGGSALIDGAARWLQGRNVPLEPQLPGLVVS